MFTNKPTCAGQTDLTRILLLLGAVILVATALFHMTGLSAAAGWLDGGRGAIVGLLWSSVAFDWVVVAIVWIGAALRPASSLRLPVLLTALIPGCAGALLLATVDAAHPGGYLLLASTVLAWLGVWRMGNAQS